MPDSGPYIECDHRGNHRWVRPPDWDGNYPSKATNLIWVKSLEHVPKWKRRAYIKSRKFMTCEDKARSAWPFWIWPWSLWKSLPDNPYIAEHGLPRFADGEIDHDELPRLACGRIEPDLRTIRLAGEIRTRRFIEDVFAGVRRNERARYAALSWWGKLWDGLWLTH